MLTVILIAVSGVVSATPETVDVVDPRAICEAASTVLKDMRKVNSQPRNPWDFSHPNVEKRVASCTEIAAFAAPHGYAVTFASVAIAYNESNFRKGVEGKDREEGRMQVMFKHHCKQYPDLNDGKGHCTNPERAGVRAIRLIQARRPNRSCVASEIRWIRGERKRRSDAGKMQTVLRANRIHAALICDLAQYNGSRRYGRKVAAFTVSIMRSFLKRQQQIVKR